MEEYYAKRANEYELVYAKPERQNEIEKIKLIIPNYFANLNLLDLGCGTGYWTQSISKLAQSIQGIDVNESVLEVAAKKEYGCPVHLNVGNYYQLDRFSGKYDGIFGGFIYSHIPLEKCSTFLESIHEVLSPNGVVVFVDNRYAEGSNSPITRQDPLGNTYQQRVLKNGEEYEVLKNFPLKSDWLEKLADKVEEFDYQEMNYYWILKYRIAKK